MTSPFAGELFSDGGDMSDIVELPVTTEDESNDEVPVREHTADSLITVSRDNQLDLKHSI